MRGKINRLGAAAALPLLWSLFGCNGALTSAVSTVTGASKSTPTQVNITDAPADAVLSLTLTINSIVLTDSAGKTVTVLSTPVTVEASHLDAVLEPLLAALSIPQDTYVSATVTVANPVVVYVDPTTRVVTTVNATLTNASTTVTFPTPIVVGTTSTPIDFDLLVGKSVTFTTTSSGTTVSVSPVFNIGVTPLDPNPTNQNNGKLNDVLGEVVSTSTSSLVVQVPNGQQVTIVTNSSTTYQNVSGLSALTAGELVDVDVTQQTSGGLLAVRVNLLPANAKSLYVGPVTVVTGSPATSFTQLVRQPLGPLAPVSATGTSYTMDVASTTTFGLPPQASTLPTLPFTPTFTAATLFAGQNVAVAAASVSGTTVTAQSVTLAPQTIDGTVSAVTSTTSLTVYTVTLNSSAALATLTGKSTVTVYVYNGTQQLNASTPTVGSTVRFNGLLFSNSGSLALVAGASCDGPGSPQTQHP